ncbi:hypothetical protein DLREEDagrD3_14300 [Denitratisoma sp. agr-D3]
MANYINKEILSEAYSHLEVPLFAEKEVLAKLKSDMTLFVSERAKFLFGDDVEVSVSFEEGSLRTKIAVIGTAATVLTTAIVNYGSFRQAVDYLSHDAIALAQSTNLEMIFRTKAAYCDRVTVEKRRGVFGRLNDAVGELDGIKNGILHSELPTRDAQLTEFSRYVDRLVRWDIKTNKLLEKLDHEETKACVAAGLLEELEQLPTVAPWAKQLAGNGLKQQIINAEPARAAEIAAIARKYEQLVKSLTSYYAKVVEQYAPKKA